MLPQSFVPIPKQESAKLRFGGSDDRSEHLTSLADYRDHAPVRTSDAGYCLRLTCCWRWQCWP
jgi:hypothetical protein